MMKNVNFLRCRLCLGESKLLVLSDEMKKLIEDFLIPKIQHWPEPEHVCNTCIDYLRVFQRFKKKVLKVQEKLEAALSNSINSSSTSISPRDQTVSADHNQAFASNSDSILYEIVRDLDTNETFGRASPKKVRNPFSKTTKNLNPLLKTKQHAEPVISNVVPIKTEAQEQEFLKCSLCDGSFKFAATLETHLRKRHTMLRCESCNYSSSERRNYVRHIRSHQNLTSKHKVCTICFTICMSSAELFAHRKKVHTSILGSKSIKNSSACTTQTEKKSKPIIRKQKSNSDRVQSGISQENEPRARRRQELSVRNIQLSARPENELPKKRAKKLRTEEPQSSTCERSKFRPIHPLLNIDNESENRKNYNGKSNPPCQESILEGNRVSELKSSSVEGNSSHWEDNEAVSQQNEDTSVCQKNIHLVKKFKCPNFCGKLLSNYLFLENHLLRLCPQRQVYNHQNFTCQVCQYRFKLLSNYLDHVYKWHTRRSNQAEDLTHSTEPQSRSYTPKKYEENESITHNSVHANVQRKLAAKGSTYMNSSSKERKLFKESSTTASVRNQLQNRTRRNSNSSNHEYTCDESQLLPKNSGSEYLSTSTSRFESNSSKKYEYNFGRPSSERNSFPDYNSRKYVSPYTNSTKPNYQKSRPLLDFRFQREFIQRQGYRNEQRSNKTIFFKRENRVHRW